MIPRILAALRRKRPQVMLSVAAIFVVLGAVYLCSIPEQQKVAAQFLNLESWRGSCLQQSEDDLLQAKDSADQARLTREIRMMRQENEALEMLPPLTVVGSPLFFINNSRYLKSISDGRHSYVTGSEVTGKDQPYIDYCDSTGSEVRGTAFLDTKTQRAISHVHVDWILFVGWNQAILHGSDGRGGGKHFFVKKNGFWKRVGKEKEWDS